MQKPDVQSIKRENPDINSPQLWYKNGSSTWKKLISHFQFSNTNIFLLSAIMCVPVLFFPVQAWHTRVTSLKCINVEIRENIWGASDRHQFHASFVFKDEIWLKET